MEAKTGSEPPLHRLIDGMTADELAAAAAGVTLRREAVAAAKALVPYAKAEYPRSAVYLFGPYAEGCNRPGRDIDVLVVVPDCGERRAEDALRSARKLNRIAGEVDARMSALVRTARDGSGLVGGVLRTGIRVD